MRETLKAYSNCRLHTTRSDVLSVVLLVLVTAGYCYGQQATGAEREKLLKEAHKQAQGYIDTVRPKLFADLSARENAIYTHIDIDLTDNDNAWETHGNRSLTGPDRSIQIDVGYVRKIEMFAEAFRLEGSTGRKVLVPYIAYVASSLNNKETYIKSPALFIGMSMKEVDKLDEPSAENRQEIATVLNSMAFVLAHEVAHHVLGHYDHPTDDKGKQREMESEADAWALNRCVKAHFSPLGGMLPLVFEYYTTAHPLESQMKNDHPADVKRLRAMFAAMIDSLSDFRADIKAQGVSYSDFRSGMKRQLDEYDWQLSSGQSVAGDSSVSPFDACMQTRINSCMEDCVHNYDYPVKECGTRLCNPEKGTNAQWAGRCRRQTR